MKIQSISSNFSNIILLKKNNSENSRYNIRFNQSLNKDVVSFSSKKYSAENISNPTNHCAYCGCKVYTQEHLDSIAKEILSLKSERLQGKIKSILEKLDGAKHSEEIALAKRLENIQEIEFFKNFLDISSKKPFLKGDAIFEQIYQKNQDEAIELLTKNMHPLLKTIDHVSPQNRKEDNMNSDINLVEACYCCNHDLKKGISFEEFFAMFPAIELNMPPDKFKYASSQILQNGQSGINKRLSADNILKSLRRLLLQRVELENSLKSIDFRIEGLKTQIDLSISSIKESISFKNQEIKNLKLKLLELNKDPEFSALQKREQLQSSLENANSAISSLNEKFQTLSSSINQLNNPQKNSKKNKNKQNNDVENNNVNQKVEELKIILKNVLDNLHSQENKKQDISNQLEILNKQFPTIESLKSEKQNLENILSLYASLKNELEIIKNKNLQKTQIETKINEIKLKLQEHISFNENFEQESYTATEQEIYKRYQIILGAISHIDQHPNGGDFNAIIKQAAKPVLETELQQLEKSNIVIDYKTSQEKLSLNSELKKLQKELLALNDEISSSQNKCRTFEQKISSIDEETAKLNLEKLNVQIKRLSEKQNDLKIIKQISALEAEIDILNQTIIDLETQKNKINC